MKRTRLLICILLVASANIALAQSTKSIKNIEQLSYGYFNQTRLTNKWGITSDLQLRTRERFTNKYSQDLFSGGLTYYFNDNTNITLGNAYASFSGR